MMEAKVILYLRKNHYSGGDSIITMNGSFTLLFSTLLIKWRWYYKVYYRLGYNALRESGMFILFRGGLEFCENFTQDENRLKLVRSKWDGVAVRFYWVNTVIWFKNFHWHGSLGDWRFEDRFKIFLKQKEKVFSSFGLTVLIVDSLTKLVLYCAEQIEQTSIIMRTTLEVWKREVC